MTYPLPVSPHDPTFRAFCQRRQLEYIAIERWRMERAATIPERMIDRPEWVEPWIRGAWHGLNLHPMRPDEIEARKRWLSERETEALQDSGWLAWNSDIAAMLHNRPALA